MLPAALVAAGMSFERVLASTSPRADASQAAVDPTVRICLARTLSGLSKLTISRSGGDFRASVVGSDAAFSLSSDQSLEVRYSSKTSGVPLQRQDDASVTCRLAAGQTLVLTPNGDEDSSDTAPSAFCLQPESDRAAQHYRGSIEVTALANGTLRVIDSLALEQYLKGVIGPEIGPSAPLEALKAQAIAARTYTIKNLGKLAFVGADLDDTNRCQNYLGVDAENWRCRTAVEQTSGEVLAYQGSLIDAVYATDCGGMTAQGDEPYLKAVSDPDCAGASPWTVTIATSTLASALAKNGVVGIANIDYVAVHDRDPSGRASTLTCTDEATGETEDVSASLVRKALGYDLLRSTLFRVSMTPDAPDTTLAVSARSKSTHSAGCSAPATGTVTFVGKGWGHGLGMCQHGAVEMARLSGDTDEQILHHFYSGVEIVPLTADLAASSPASANPAGQSAWSASGLAAYAAKSRGGHSAGMRLRTLFVSTRPTSDASADSERDQSGEDESARHSDIVSTRSSARISPRRGF